MARAGPAAITRWPRLLAAIEPSNGSVMNSGSISAPGIRLGVHVRVCHVGADVPGRDVIVRAEDRQLVPRHVAGPQAQNRSRSRS